MTWFGPTRVLSVAEMRRVDALASAEFNLPSRLLMENAGVAVAREALARLRPGKRVFVMVGPGANGGDGLVAARHLSNQGAQVEAFLTTEDLRGDAAANLEAFRQGGGFARLAALGRTDGGVAELAAGEGDVVIDALFGVGLTRPPEGLAREAIEAINAARERGAAVIAVDLPSGLDADTGRAPGVVVLADVTVVCGYLKRGLVLEPGTRLAGRLEFADISLPRRAERTLGAQPLFLLREDEIQAVLPQRPVAGHKGSFGHVAAVAGSPGKTGAAALAALGALRGGAGLVTLIGRREVVEAAQRHAPELMGHFLPGEGPLSLADLPALLEACGGKDVLAMGPGLWRGPETGLLVARLVRQAAKPAVLDADALTAMAELGELPVRAEAFRGFVAPVVLTPHPGEMARLASLTIAQVQDDRLGVARRIADAFRATTLLKGARTIIADVTGATAINPTGNSGMATGGTGDILTGLVAALLAQRMTPGNAACAAAYIHGLAGERASARHGQTGLLASDLLAALGEVFAAWSV